jgi:hypothetical protein
MLLSVDFVNAAVQQICLVLAFCSYQPVVDIKVFHWDLFIPKY